ncbi:MAG: LysM peptidoglycan-binding domain-containing protein [Niabella sp.]
MNFNIKRYIVLAGFVAFFSAALQAQDKLFAKTANGAASLTHTVQPKESLYSLARKYNVPVATLAAANKIDKNKGLSLGEKLNIPLTADNFNQSSTKGTPVYYTISDGEGLGHVSKKFGGVSYKNLRDWNKLSKDELRKEQALIVGYLKSDGSLPSSQGAAPTAVKSDDKKEDKATAAIKPAEKPKAEPEKPKKEETAKATPAKAEKKAPSDADKKQEEVVKIVEKKVEKKEEPVPVVVQEVIEEPEGSFKQAFTTNTDLSQTVERTVESGIFKTDKGWNDFKYYLLIDGVAAGTIVKVSNPENKQVVYAKVLGPVTDYGKGFDARISDAAAAKLRIVGSEKFYITLNY